MKGRNGILLLKPRSLFLGNSIIIRKTTTPKEKT
jgi:hypothetical protein